MKLSAPADARALRRSNGSVAEWRTRGMVEVLTVQEVAAYLKLPISTVYRLACRGDLPCQKVGRQWRFHKAALDDWFRRAPGRETAAADDADRMS
jgi:excisionase family DNA binding protein